MKWLPLPILFASIVGGCNFPPEPLVPAEKPFHLDGCACLPDLNDGDCGDASRQKAIPCFPVWVT